MHVQLHADLLEREEFQHASDVLRKCVHCGFCNTTCPTYNLLGNELDGPRGRIYLVKEMFESNAVSETAVKHLDRCLTCRNCETTCPAGVEFGDLIETGREFIRAEARRGSMLERLLLALFSRKTTFEIIYLVARLFRFLLPSHVRVALGQSIPRKDVSVSDDADIVLMQGCVQDVLTPDVVAKVQQLLTSKGASCTIVPGERCCGGLHLHRGFTAVAKRFMQRNIEGISTLGAKHIVSSASGCGVTLKDYGRILNTSEAREFSSRVIDVVELLETFKFQKNPAITKVAFHSPCTLQHGQKINGRVEALLSSTGYELTPISRGNECCGSAGTYSIFQPRLATDLKRKKVGYLQEFKPDIIATANVGCQLHLQTEADIPVVHWVELLN